MKQMMVVFLFLPAFAFCQKKDKPKDPTEDEVKAVYNALPKIDGNYEFSEVVELDTSFKKDDLYKNAKLFFTDIFKSAKDVLQYDDRAEGKVIGKGSFQFSDEQIVFLTVVDERRTINFTVEIFNKDGKYKYRFYNINADCFSSFTGSGASRAASTTNTTLSIDEAFKRTSKGSDKKMERRLFMAMIAEINLTIEQLKKYMSKKQSASDF